MLAHELAHCFGHDDVYDTIGHDTSGKFQCIMERYEWNYVNGGRIDEAFYADILSGEDAFCEDCEEKMRMYLANASFAA